ncbi:11829_t:CDS:2 [Entrophospora sp. SA101]|nr:11829_t:CDS:2 [Entrophospora sp. SA101]
MSDMDDLLDFEDGGIDFPTNENYDLTTASTTIDGVKNVEVIEKITKIEVATEDKSGDDNETLVKQDTFDFDNLEEFNINDSDFLKNSSQQQQTSSPQKQIPSLQAAQRHHQQQQQLHFHQMQQQQQLLILQQQQLLANQNAQNFRGRNLRKNNDWRQPNLNAGAFLNGVMSPFRPGFAPGQMIGPNIHVNPNFARLRPHVLPFGNPLMQYPGGPHMNMLPYQGQMEIPQYHPSMNPMAGRVARRQMNSSPSGKPITKVAPQSTTPSSTGGSNSNKLIISNVDENVTKRELQALASNVPGGPLVSDIVSLTKI